MSFSANLPENRVAVFVDFENIKRAVDEFFVNERVDLQLILEEITRITRGRILLKRAYADWGSFKDYRSDLLDNATEPVQAFSLTQKGKNGADIRIAIDVMEFVLRQSDITHVALVSGDSDFTPLVMKLRELGRHVIGVGVRSNTSTYLAKSCDRFVFYDDLRASLDSARAAGDLPDAEHLLGTALASLGGRPVPGSALKLQMRKHDANFDEARYGFGSFLEFLKAHADLVDIYKPTVGDVTVAPKGGLTHFVAPAGIEGENFFAPPLPASSTMTVAERYRLYLRDNNFRYVPFAERRQIIDVLYTIFYEAEETEGVSLKEAKDRLHAWFEANRPAIPWDSINSTVYHLFYTWCFAFDRNDEGDGKQLWDRRTTLQGDIGSVDDLVYKCERGVVRKVWERERGDIDADALNQWLYDGAEETLPRVHELIEAASSSGYGTAVRPT